MPQRDSLVALRDLEPSAWESVLAQLAGAPRNIGVEELGDLASGGLSPDHPLDVHALLFMVAGLCRLVGHHGETPAAVVDAVVSSPDLEMPDGSRKTALRERLVALLNTEVLANAVTALDLRLEQERTFLSARVITDIRPVFGRDVSEPPVGALISSVLRIEYGEPDGSNGSFFVALTDGDLERLSGIIERAQKKSRSLATLLDAVPLPQFLPGDTPT